LVVIGKDGNSRRRTCTGKLRYPGHQPDFIADPNHRVKTVRNAIKTLQKAKVGNTAECLEVDTLCVSKNFEYFFRTLHTLPESEWESAAKAVINHHFDIHDDCGAFCVQKDKSIEDRAASGKFYRCQTKDAILYDALQEAIDDYLKKRDYERLPTHLTLTQWVHE
jgi:hypothetical protein